MYIIKIVFFFPFCVGSLIAREITPRNRPTFDYFSINVLFYIPSVAIPLYMFPLPAYDAVRNISDSFFRLSNVFFFLKFFFLYY